MKKIFKNIPYKLKVIGLTVATPLMMKSCEKIPDHVDKPETIEMALRRTHKDAMMKPNDISRAYAGALDALMKLDEKKASFYSSFQMGEIEYHRVLLKSISVNGFSSWSVNATNLREFLITIEKYLEETITDKKAWRENSIRRFVRLSIKGRPHEQNFWREFNQLSMEKFDGDAKTFGDTISNYKDILNGPLGILTVDSRIIIGEIMTYQTMYGTNAR
ncbi:MAG: hypothetical protein FWE52_01570 [Alphaproteobacteria bacterium]|nr:hypothetical protein [Alphaproteobacteria bacterium]